MEKCQCSSKGQLSPGFQSWYDTEKELPFVNHAPNECKCTNNLKQYKRGKKKLWLCSCCTMGGDVEI